MSTGNPTGQRPRPKFSPPTVFIKMGGDGKPMREDGPSTPSNVKILGPRGGRGQGRPGNGQGGRPAPQMNGGRGQQPQFAPPQQPAVRQLDAAQLTLCRLLVHGYLKRGVDDLGDDNLKLAALTLDQLDKMLEYAAATAPPPAPRVVQPAQAPRGVVSGRAVQSPPQPPEDLDYDPVTGMPLDVLPQARSSGIAPRRVVRAASSVGMPAGVVAAPEAIEIGADDVGDVSDIIDVPPG